ncbi:Tetrapyrrole methylase [Lasiodiplodia theobromae]|uniref:Diphthine methyl ester synthase n=1 Tax=Lasiodiplodia theobromae TaxID=45133 RepID=A0A5N5D4S1_9PEZI|nr:Diphthine synthase [Lasiodiplodia theobromae]KAB2572422.1 Diphthine methyl ester synthase [Lasiodiplodia theobromae]KAF4536624.1 Diphthine synthase [Lasiodiplodia theobromae]KAF9634431.1 Tetrapyrrole methylase [Lasiodiplodia theobromae]
MLHFIGLGLADEKDVTVRGLEIIKRAERVYLEAYTAVLLVDKETLEAFYGRSVIIADREMVESSSDDILADADKVDVAFLVVGDPFGATTHTDLVLRARELNIPTNTVPNASILTGVGCTGLQLYNFGQTISMVFFTDNWRPASWYDKILENDAIGLHTLVLLDIKVKEPNLEALARGKIIYEPPRFMSVAQCAQQMIEIEEEKGNGICGKDALAVGVARVGAPDQTIVAGTLEQLSQSDLGKPLHSLVLIGKNTHDLERDYLRAYAVDPQTFDDAWAKKNERK